MENILFIAVIGAALYFLMIRPQQKRAKEQKAKMASLEPGARVMTISGIFGTIRHLGEKQAIIEVAPGVEFTIDKRAISTQPVEDEFEYVDEAGDETPDELEPSIEDLNLDPTVFDPTPPAEPISPVEPTEEPRQN
ncbi:MAG: preprotein translocase subunit YajC [Propionibacteriaceae bacterium]|nr:preprotein translocase subunit YajC [Propionibacteriaceae bacterium]